MRAWITEDGELHVMAEDSTEAYALGRWFENNDGAEDLLTLVTGDDDEDAQ